MTSRIRRAVALAACLAAIFLLGRASPAWSLDRDQRIRALLATVQVVVPDDTGTPTSSGSGAILDAAKGYILTNYHVVGDADAATLFNKEGMAVIGLNPPGLRGVPIFKYVARVVQADPDVDLALLQVVAPFDDLSGSLPSNLGLTAVDRGSSHDLLIGDPIYVLGFPGLGGDTITYTEGTVSGFLDENHDGVEEWIKTDAEVNHGNSGGLAVNDAGQFIGVPSAGYTDAEAAGKISLIRPADLALGFYDRWTLDASQPATAAPVLGDAMHVGKSNTPRVTLGPLTFARGVNTDSSADGPGRSFANVREIYAIFEADGLRDGVLLGTVWTLDGQTVLENEAPWDQGAVKAAWVSISHADGLPIGRYVLKLYVDGALAQTGSFAVAERSPELAPSTVNMTGRVYDANNRRRGVSGALVIVLLPGVTLEKWMGEQFAGKYIYASGTTTQDGSYQLDKRLQTGATYALTVVQQQYRPMRQNEFLVPESAADPYVLDISLERK